MSDEASLTATDCQARSGVTPRPSRANVRLDLRMDRESVASVREHGILQPVIADRGAEGVRLRLGDRRTLAALIAEMTTVPVIVGDDLMDEAGRQFEHAQPPSPRKGLRYDTGPLATEVTPTDRPAITSSPGGGLVCRMSARMGISAEGWSLRPSVGTRAHLLAKYALSSRSWQGHGLVLASPPHDVSGGARWAGAPNAVCRVAGPGQHVGHGSCSPCSLRRPGAASCA
jgi:hypothetical protein